MVEPNAGAGSGPGDFCGLGGAGGAVEAAGRGAARFGRRVRSCFWGKARRAGPAGDFGGKGRSYGLVAGETGGWLEAEQDGKAQRGRGFGGGGTLSSQSAELLSKNNNNGWCFLEAVGWNCCKGWFGWEGYFFLEGFFFRGL